MPKVDKMVIIATNENGASKVNFITSNDNMSNEKNAKNNALLKPKKKNTKHGHKHHTQTSIEITSIRKAKIKGPLLNQSLFQMMVVMCVESRDILLKHANTRNVGLYHRPMLPKNLMWL